MLLDDSRLVSEKAEIWAEGTFIFYRDAFKDAWGKLVQRVSVYNPELIVSFQQQSDSIFTVVTLFDGERRRFKCSADIFFKTYTQALSQRPKAIEEYKHE